MALEFLDQHDAPSAGQRPSAAGMLETILRTLGVEQAEAAAIVARAQAAYVPSEVPPVNNQRQGPRKFQRANDR